MLPLPRGHGGEPAESPGAGSEVVVRIRNLKVWFAQRGGLLKELLAGGGKWVRAVDGVSFDVRRGEVFCLVGESGCGKTTTGKAILRLVDITEGEILLEMPNEEYGKYVEAEAKGVDDPESQATLQELRRKYSLTWKEHRAWTLPHYLIAILMIGIATGGSLLGFAAVLGFLTQPFADVGGVYLFSIALGVVMGVVGVLPPARPSRRAPLVLTILAFIVWFLMPIPAFYFHGWSDPVAASLSPVDAIGAAWGPNTFYLILAGILVPVIAGAVAQGIVGHRLRSGEYSGIQMRSLRKRLQLIFQDPYESLNPKQSVYEIVAEPLRVNKLTKSPEETADIVAGALTDTGLRPPEEFMFRFPHELSGGQRQRVSIAAGLVLQPDFIVADEPVSMLDVSIRTEIIQLMMDLRTKRALTYLFITHDLSLAWILADRIAVMYLGEIVEQGTAEQVVAHPKHPYTQALISVVPSPDPRHKATRTILKGERPDPADMPTGCRFHPRCPMAFERCGWSPDEVLDVLKELAGSGPMEAALRAAASDTALSIRLPPSSGDLEAWIREQKRTQAGTHRALQALRGITGPPDARRVLIYGWEPVRLVEITPGNDVACLLVKPGPPETPPVEAAA